jgi:DNA polymerase III alpha subunit
MALMDRDNLCGAPRFYMAAKKIGANAHLGAEITGEDGDSYPLLAESRTGYQNLCRLITSMKLRAPKGKAAASDEELTQFSEGLVCLTGEGPPLRSRFEKRVRIDVAAQDAASIKAMQARGLEVIPLDAAAAGEFRAAGKPSGTNWPTC